ncbi:hypothetical protein UFOVP1670_73 [uncultured Caudovirales phage]|uniref:Uncharacterized protein n=1 Tax=uncultured Caudovirales phage TaxID=2100421 RepID=A0A6J5T6V9_9CAUD|nr:hypothetical protein UFOVP1670_73 [uncultured Caudovirales phage]
MNEETAKTKWCPMVRANLNMAPPRPLRAPGPNDLPLDRNPPESRCIASACMMWKWRNATEGADGKLYMPAQSESENRQPYGYCGLSGSVDIGGYL